MSSSRYLLTILTAASLLAISACQKESQAPAAAEAASPPIPVGVVEVRPEAIAVVSELPGRISPTRIAEVRPRVGGIILERIFEQGTDVQEGDTLFRIDPATFEATVEAARAGVMRADAVLLQARQEEARTRTLVDRNTVGQANLDVATAQLKQSEADLALQRANLRTAEINLDYATVRAPISGRIGRAIVTEGALVSTTDSTAMATIQQLNPVYADIQQPVSELLRLRSALKEGTLTQLEPDVAQVRLKLDDGSEYQHPGRLLFSEATVDPNSGQVTLRAEFPNLEDTLLPGLYVRVAVDQGVDAQAMAVPNQSIQRDTAGQALVYLVDKENKVAIRPVVVSRVVGNRSVISQGLESGDRVIADGIQKIGPGAIVEPTPWTSEADAAVSLGGETGNQAAVGVGTSQPNGGASQETVDADPPATPGGKTTDADPTDAQTAN